MLSKGVSILHDNARPHAACQTVTLLQRFGWDIITHPPYSPDLAPNDFHLFSKLKGHLFRMCFNNDDEVKDAAQRFLKSMAVNCHPNEIYQSHNQKLNVRYSQEHSLKTYKPHIYLNNQEIQYNPTPKILRLIFDEKPLWKTHN